jgi:hypothetical protein
MPKIPGRLITYCTNIHPGETWAATFAALRKHIPAIKEAFSPDEPFPIGLRLSDRAASELTDDKNGAFRLWLEEHDCFVPTINGFPFGSFHGRLLKERVYEPDWRSHKRTDYTLRLAELLAGWLPQGITGSISTVPLGHRGAMEWLSGNRLEIRAQLETVLRRLALLHDAHGKKIILALEPEPGCRLETTEEFCRFYESLDLAADLKRHLGICYDCCHQAVEFEDPVAALRRLAAAGVPLAKVQISSALKVKELHALLLTPFDEPFYLHQVVIRGRDGSLTRFDDISDAIFHHSPREGEEWRCHFHVPIFSTGSGRVGTTTDFLNDILPLLPTDVLLEVETYTWDVLPAELRRGSVTDSIIKELKWLKERLDA